MSSQTRLLTRSPRSLVAVALVALVALLASVMLALAPSPASALTAPTVGPSFGTQFHGTWASYTDATRAQVLDTLKANGATSVRIDISWEMLEPNQSGKFDPWGLQMVDKVIAMAAERGLNPLVTLWLAPSWANGSSDERVAPTSTAGLAALTDVSQRLAARYSGAVVGWEVWNEPNSSDFMRGANPVTYAALLKAAYVGFKAGDPATPVVFGGTMYVDTPWITKVLAAGGARYYDVMAVHPYSGVADEPPDLPSNATMWRMNYLPTLIAAMGAYGGSTKRIWFTEFGWSVHPTAAGSANWQRGVTAAQQADYLNRTIALLRARYPMVTRVYWYQDRAESADRTKAGYGLVYSDGSVTPALSAVPKLYQASTAPTAKPVAPKPVQATVVGTVARVTWTASTTGTARATAYYVQLRKVGTNQVSTIKVPATTRTAAMPALQRGTAYRITVTGTNPVGIGPSALSPQLVAR